MFPTPIDQTHRSTQLLFKIGLPVALLVWLLPIIAVALTSVRGGADLSNGNYWGLPTEWKVWENYTAVFSNTPLFTYILNSFLVTIPTVIGALTLACMAGFALGVYRFKLNLLVFFLFVGGNFVPFQILMIPVRDLSLNLGLYDTITGLVLFIQKLSTPLSTRLVNKSHASSPPFCRATACRRPL